MTLFPFFVVIYDKSWHLFSYWWVLCVNNPTMCWALQCRLYIMPFNVHNNPHIHSSVILWSFISSQGTFTYLQSILMAKEFHCPSLFYNCYQTEGDLPYLLGSAHESARALILATLPSPGNSCCHEKTLLKFRNYRIKTAIQKGKPNV